MAIFSYRNQAAECGVKKLYLEFLVGATGAVGAFARRQGFTQSPAAAVRTGVGAYTLNLDQRWQALVDSNGFARGAFVASDGSRMTVTTVNLNQAQPTVAVQFVQSSGAAAEIANGNSCVITLELKDSTV